MLQDLLRREPFEPFVVVTAAGDRYAVRHPEMALLLQTRLRIALTDNGDVTDRAVYVPLLHISAIEDLQAA